MHSYQTHRILTYVVMRSCAPYWFHDHLQAGQRGAGLRRVVVLGDDLDHSGFVAAEKVEHVAQQAGFLRCNDLHRVRPHLGVVRAWRAARALRRQAEFGGDGGQGGFQAAQAAPVAADQQRRGELISDRVDPAFEDIAPAIGDFGNEDRERSAR